MVSLERIHRSPVLDVTKNLPRFDAAGDLEGAKEANPQTLESMGNLERDLLKSQLNDLESWITKVRDIEIQQGSGRPLPPPIDDEDLAPPGVESLLRAQVQELEGWLIEARTPQRTNPQSLPQFTENDEELLMEIRRERAWSVRRPMKPKDETIHAQQRLDSAFTALSHMRDMETQRELALQQTRSASLQTSEEFTRLFNQLHELEADPLRAPDLARYSITDVALALVNAIEQRRGLAVQLEAALRAQDFVRLGADGHEQLLTCAAALPLITRHATAEGPESPEILYAPAGHLTLPEGPLGHQNVDIQDLQILRIHKLGEQNRILWEQLYGHWDVGARGGSRRAPVMDNFLEPYSPGRKGNVALRSELQTLRANEGRLDALLGGQALASPLNGGSAAPIHAANLPSMQAFIERELELERMLKPAKVATFGKYDLGPFTLFTMEEMMQAWCETARRLTHWRRSRRAEACERFLTKKSSAKALRWWLGGLMFEVASPIPQSIKRGDRVKDLSNNKIGTFLSATPKGICKIQWAPNDLSLRPKSMLSWLRMWPHPAFGGLFFLAWARILVVREHMQVARFRNKVVGTKEEAKSSNLLVWLSAQASDNTTLARICFETWKKMSIKKKSEHMDLLADVWMIWRHGAMINRHSRAVNELEATSGELRSARLEVLRQTSKFEKIAKRMSKIDDMQNGIYLSFVLASWHYAIQTERMKQSVSMAGRDERIKMVLNLSDKLEARTQEKMIPAIFNAWHFRVKRRLQAGKQQATLGIAFSHATLSVTFQEWKGLIMGHHQDSAEKDVAKLTAELAEKQEEFERLQLITEELYGFAKEADVRVKQLETALTSADKAVENGTMHGGVLEKEVSSLETQLRGLEARVRRGEEAERELQRETDITSSLKVELAATRGEKESLANKIGVVEAKMQKVETDLEQEKRHVAALDAEKAIIESSLEAARSDALEWKLRYEEEAGDFAAGIGDLSDESDIMEALDEDEDGKLTKKGKKDLKKAVKAGKVSEEKAAARLKGAVKKKGKKDDAKTEATKDRVWEPDGEVPRWSALMPYESAQVIIEHGADFDIVKPGWISSGSEKNYFTVYEFEEQTYLTYWRSKADFDAGKDARGAFSLKDVTTATFNFKTQEITLSMSSTKKKDALRTLTNVDGGFYEALLVVTREAEYRRVHSIFHGETDEGAKRRAEREGQMGKKETSGEDVGREVSTGTPLTPMTTSKDPKREAERQRRKEEQAKAIAERLAYTG